MDMVAETPHKGESRLEAMVSTAASQEQVYRLFDIVPGLDYCDFDRRSGLCCRIDPLLDSSLPFSK